MPSRRHKASRTAVPHRERSIELGSPSRTLQYNKQTGRPIRNSAGKKQSEPGYVDSTIIDDDLAGESCSEDEEGNPIQHRNFAKRKRSPSPTPPPLEPVIYDQMSSTECEGESSESDLVKSTTLTFNIPPGFEGPLMVKLEGYHKASSLGEKQAGQPNIWSPQRSSKKRMKVSNNKKRRSPKQSELGFLSLPPELRNNIYRRVFVTGSELHFALPDNFCRSSALLRTCKQIHEEARTILYGENKFVFVRNRNTRAPFWDPVPKEVGYKDIRLFLKLIGPTNLSFIREVRISFEDAMPASTPYLHTQEARRFLNDEYLIDCLRLLRQSELRKLTLCFHGRRSVVDTDVRFLNALERVQADQVYINNGPRWYQESKIAEYLRKPLIEAMTRDPKLYTT